MEINKVKRVYVAEYNGNFKIGISNNVSRRMKQLLCGCPTIKVVYKSDFLEEAFELERYLHKIYSKNNIGGEWFSSVDLEEIKKVVAEKGTVVANYEELKKRKIREIQEKAYELGMELFPSAESFKQSKDERNLTDEELRFENEEISKFTIAVNGVDIPNIYSDLIYDVLFGKNTEKLLEEYKTSTYESFRNYLTDEQNEEIKRYTTIIGHMINNYWEFSRIKEFIENF